MTLAPRLLALSWIALLAITGCHRQDTAATRPATKAAGADNSTFVLVAYYTRTGNTKQMADAVAEGARRIEGVAVDTKAIAEVTVANLERADGLVLGGPTHYANIPGPMKTILDKWASKHHVDFEDKVGGAFATGGDLTGGKEHVIVSLLLYMLNNRMVVVGPISKQGVGGWGAMGAGADTGPGDDGLSEDELEGARRLGERVAEVSRRRAE